MTILFGRKKTKNVFLEYLTFRDYSLERIPEKVIYLFKKKYFYKIEKFIINDEKNSKIINSKILEN